MIASVPPTAVSFVPSPIPRLPAQPRRPEEFDKYVGRMCGKLDSARRRFLVVAAPGRSLVSSLKYQRFCRLLFEALDEHEDLRDYSKSLEKSVQFWSLDSQADLRFVLRYITEKLGLPATLFPLFATLVSDLCAVVGFSTGAAQFIKDVIAAQ